MHNIPLDLAITAHNDDLKEIINDLESLKIINRENQNYNRNYGLQEAIMVIKDHLDKPVDDLKTAQDYLAKTVKAKPRFEKLLIKI